MSKKIKILFFCVFLVGISIPVCKRLTMHELKILRIDGNKEKYTYSDDIQFNYDPFGARPKVVTYLKTEAIYELKKWIYFINDYPNISFIFFITDDHRIDLEKGLKEIQFPLPVFFDFDLKNPNYDYLLITYVLDSNNKILGIANPTVPEFKKMLIPLN